MRKRNVLSLHPFQQYDRSISMYEENSCYRLNLEQRCEFQGAERLEGTLVSLDNETV